MTVETTLYFGPAEVLSVAADSDFARVCLADGECCRARLALAVPYHPAIGDEVLVAAQGREEVYIIGVLKGKGTTVFRAPGDLSLEAPHGAVRIRAAQGLELRSQSNVDISAPRTTIRAGRLSLLATTIVQRAANAYTWATGLLQAKSKRMRQVSDEGWLVRAGRAHVKTTENVNINGKTIHLG